MFIGIGYPQIISIPISAVSFFLEYSGNTAYARKQNVNIGSQQRTIAFGSHSLSYWISAISQHEVSPIISVSFKRFALPLL